MSLPISEGTPAGYTHYYGFGGSNQAFRASSFQPLTPDTDGPNEFLYVPNSSGHVVDLTAEVQAIQDDLVVIHNEIDSLPVISFGTIGTTPNANGGTITAGVIHLQPASDTTGGVLTALAQEIGGDKTFTEDIYAEKTIDLAQTVDATIGVISMAGQPYIHSYGDASNTFVGRGSCIGNTPAPHSENTVIGNNSLTKIIAPAQGNTALGNACLPNLTTGQANVAVGWATMALCVTGSSNVAVGNATLSNAKGSRNTAIGHNVGTAVDTANDTINIGCASGSDTSGEINIGTLGTHTTCNIAGVAGVAPGGTPQAVIVNPTTGQLGSRALAAAVSFAAVGAVPNANGGSAASNVITLQPADATNPGVVTTGAQTIAGAKTLSGALVASSTVTLSAVTGNPGGTPMAVIINPSGGLLGSQAIPINTRSAVTNFTLTLNNGVAITSLVVRGVTQATLPVTFWRVGDIVTALFPQFVVNYASGTPDIMNLNASTPASYRPTNTQRMPVMLQNGSVANGGLFEIASAGSFLITTVPYVTMLTGSGMYRDQTFTWAVL